MDKQISVLDKIPFSEVFLLFCVFIFMLIPQGIF